MEPVRGASSVKSYFCFLGIKLIEQKKSQTVRGTSASPGLLETKQMVRLSLLGQSTRQTG